MEIIYFESQFDFRKWLEKNHQKKSELIVGFYKIGTKIPSITWSESVDQALCFGWIDGIRRSIDKDSYCIRFTPRKKSSIWSAINIKKVEVLTQKGWMQDAGLIAFSFRNEDKSNIYLHELENIVLDKKYENQFKKNKLAWDFFISLAPSYRKGYIHWIIRAKQEKTKLQRLEKTINACINKKKSRQINC